MPRQKLDIVRLQPPAAAAAASMDLSRVNKDVLIEILLRLPAKSLIRFKSVCKKWLSLISSDYFCHQHTLRRPKLQQSLIIKMHPFHFFYFNPTTNGEKVMIPYTLRVPDNHQIVQDCNGLLLLEVDPELEPLEHSLKHCLYFFDSIPRESRSHFRNSYYVYNPTTRQSRKITLTDNDKYPFVAGMALAFDPSKSPYYKIVCIRSNEESHLVLGSYTYQIEVYDSESHTWKLGFKPFIHPKFFGGVHWNNSIYWSMPGYSGYCSFDIANNEMKTLAPPPFSFESDAWLCCFEHDLQESNGYLYHFEYDSQWIEGEQRILVAVWELGADDHSQWLLKHHRKIPRCSHIICFVRSIRGSDGDEDETFSLVTYEHGKIMAYNFLDKSYELLLDLACQPDVKMSDSMIGFQFGEILALV